MELEALEVLQGVGQMVALTEKKTNIGGHGQFGVHGVFQSCMPWLCRDGCGLKDMKGNLQSMLQQHQQQQQQFKNVQA